ncbi:MAG: TetR/AcrR family transcriptional regulator [Desulfobacula sp.]|nr:TetR/AcrR family transcriptional regulator [Desulfobacula sp.]MBT3484583.1 TetR/AcrR family transcriptional regulator [Desulfobacula sp.]MBT3803953.1 TetR/AcrR family transcriptional regulator [Desulfobacula sp.]MBT4023568.1 TetR/AcrR family transcriptional regulator [Desulfobacula sp.]MBT4197764.1 TetR/AcrR family transcriptional regulator [Desulfobacula sp.]
MKKSGNEISAVEVPTQIKNPELVRERRRQIIDSTVKLFIEHGYHKTTTRMIAKASNFSIGSLYEYVSSKEDLLYLVCKTIHEEVQDAVEKALSNTDKEKERLASAVRQYFYVCDKLGDHILLMYQVTQFLPEKWKEDVLVNELNITDIFINALSSLSGKNKFPKLDDKTINLVGHNISVLGQMWAFRRWHVQRNFTIEEYIRIQTNFILGLIF